MQQVDVQRAGHLADLGVHHRRDQLPAGGELELALAHRPGRRDVDLLDGAERHHVMVDLPAVAEDPVLVEADRRPLLRRLRRLDPHRGALARVEHHGHVPVDHQLRVGDQGDLLVQRSAVLDQPLQQVRALLDLARAVSPTSQPRVVGLGVLAEEGEHRRQAGLPGHVQRTHGDGVQRARQGEADGGAHRDAVRAGRHQPAAVRPRSSFAGSACSGTATLPPAGTVTWVAPTVSRRSRRRHCPGCARPGPGAGSAPPGAVGERDGPLGRRRAGDHRPKSAVAEPYTRWRDRPGHVDPAGALLEHGQRGVGPSRC